METEPVHTRRHRRRRIRTIALAAAGALTILMATPAIASAATATHRPKERVTLELESPEARTKVWGSTDLVFSGENLASVTVSSQGREVARVAASADGRSATVTIDTTGFRDGARAFVARGWGASGRPPAAVEAFTLKIANKGADSAPDGASLVFAEEFSGNELDRDRWCTRYQYWEPTSQPSQEELAAADPACYRITPLTQVEMDKTTSVLNQYKSEAEKAAAAGESDIASWYETRIGEISANTGVADNGDDTYDFSNAYDPAYGFHDTLGGWDIRPAPGAPEWELPQEEQVYRDVNSEGDPTHVVSGGHLSMLATHTRQEAPVLQYESAMIRSQQEFLPTWDAPLYLTARVRAPEVLGTFPAFWLINGFGDGTTPVGWPPEIDIYEGPYNNDGSFPTGGQFDSQFHVGLVDYLCEDACGPITWFDYGDVLGETPDDTVGFDTQWHDWHAADPITAQWIEVGAAWYPDRVCFYVEGERFACASYRWGLPGTGADGPLANPAALMLNHAFGGRWGGHNGEETDKLPASFDIDHLRVYELPATTADQLTPIP
ncbi:glycoside hydrolase family 16 protein [Microbacterium immunditiarum]|uniref:GH16 domain-containing protein n=1 Tax=Microbacterium immunditiarum TaxID=337480 RepID=A0A7Y9GM44_9MICO|nr:hypothetical protein [Microbacterium immunditiarum]NYE19007.1 hypothetical protein [Microbacterium immunditiarum]